MTKIFCDCCKREIGHTEPKYSIEISKGYTTEHKLTDVCDDCYSRFRDIIDNAEWMRCMPSSVTL